jgi:hypothetical protein
MSAKKPLTRRIFFSGGACALAAHIVRPDEHYLDAVACSWLPAAGGRAESHGHNHRHGLFSYESAHTSAYGDFVPGASGQAAGGDYPDDYQPAETSVKVTVQGFRIEAPRDPNVKGSFARTLRIEHLTSELGSYYEGKGPTEFRSLRAVIDGVSVDGRSLIVKTNPEPFLGKTLDDAFQQRCKKQILIPGNEIMLGTVVTDLYWQDGEPQDARIQGNRLDITGLGSLYFGEILVQEGFRRLVLVRAQLGCVNGGSGTTGDSSSKINWVPPN